MTKDEARNAANVMLAYAEGKVIQRSGRWTNRKWSDFADHNFDWSSCDYRVRPELKLRPWTKSEVPLPLVFKHKEGGSIFTASDVDTTCAYHLAGLCIVTKGYRELLESHLHTTDGGKTWKPCGVVES